MRLRNFLLLLLFPLVLLTTRGLHWTRLCRLSNAIKTLSSCEVTNHKDSASSISRNIESPLWGTGSGGFWSSWLTTCYHCHCACNLFSKHLRPFLKTSVQLWLQWLLDAVSGFTDPVAQDCLHQFTRLINFLLSGKASHLIAPRFCRTPITALHKKNGKVHLMTVWKTMRHLDSRVCYLSVKDNLPDLLLP